MGSTSTWCGLPSRWSTPAAWLGRARARHHFARLLPLPRVAVRSGTGVHPAPLRRSCAGDRGAGGVGTGVVPVRRCFGWLAPAEFEAERAAIAQGSAAERAHLVDEILAGALPDVESAERTLGYRLSRTHIGVRIWADVCVGTGRVSRVTLRETATRISTLLGSQPPLLIQDGPALLAAWVPLPADSAPMAGHEAVERSVHDRTGVRAAVGNPGKGIDGFERPAVKRTALMWLRRRVLT